MATSRSARTFELWHTNRPLSDRFGRPGAMSRRLVPSRPRKNLGRISRIFARPVSRRPLDHHIQRHEETPRSGRASSKPRCDRGSTGGKQTGKTDQGGTGPSGTVKTVQWRNWTRRPTLKTGQGGTGPDGKNHSTPGHGGLWTGQSNPGHGGRCSGRDGGNRVRAVLDPNGKSATEGQPEPREHR